MNRKRKISLLIVMATYLTFAVAMTAAQSAVQFLSNWKTENGKRMPLMVGNTVQLTGTATICPSGCQTAGQDFIALFTARTPNLTVPNVTIAQLAGLLHDDLQADYCGPSGSDMRNRNIQLAFDFVDRNGTTIGNFLFTPTECLARQNPTPSTTTVAVSADQQFWDAVKTSSRVQDYQGYLNNFPNGQFAALARLKIDQISPQTVQQPAVPRGGSADQQFWDAVKNSQRSADFQSYLTNFPNGQFAALARLKIDQLSPTPPVIGQPVIPSGGSADQQFWDAIKTSQRVQDYNSYLQNFPNGQFAPLARLKIDQLNQTSTITPSPSGGSGQDLAFWDAVKTSQRVSDYQSYLNNFPNGQFAALARLRIDQLNSGGGAVQPPPVSGSSAADQQFWDAVKNSQRVSDYQSYLQNFPSGQFAGLARLKIDQLTRNSTPRITTSRNSQFLNQVAADNRAKLPVTSGRVELFDAVSICPSGCQQSASTESILIRARTPAILKQNTSIGQIESSLKPAMLKGYCGSPEQLNNVAFGIDVTDKFSQKIGNFFIDSRDCTGSTGNLGPSTTPAPPQTVLPSGRTEAQLFAAAQIGSLSELARARNFFVTTSSVDAKTKITNAIRKELPQLGTAASQSAAEFFIGVNFTDRKTGAEVQYDANNPDLRGEFIVFTVTQWVNQSPFSIRIHFRQTKDRNWGVFSDTPEENAAKEFAKQFAKIMTP